MMLEWALRYASKGWAVFPTHSIMNGHCTCGKTDCSAPGKHPIHAGGFKNATTDPVQIKFLFNQQKPVNIGIATGALSGIFVIDIDVGPKKNGLTAFRELEAKYGPANKEMLVQTGSGGLHIYRPTQGRAVPSSASKIGPNIDVRGEAGYVIAPPSLHISGNQYMWITE
ncbi:bifunctional DNA primase/polymerase [Leisingera sp. D0M16]|uniref:bifunctional DNA primase/polymerase n=1 Tax=Leisingera coralii TaxID=3351347 RepID=UPI003B7CCD6D